MSYAIVKVGGKQYRVEEGDSILVDRMRADEGDKVELEPLLFADGAKSLFDGGDLGKVKIQAVVTGHEKGKKIHGLKFKPKRGYKVRYGARADLTRIEIKDIKLLSRKPAAKTDEVSEEKPKTSAKPKPAAEKQPAAEKKAPAKKKAPAEKKAPAKKTSGEKKTASAKKSPAKKKAAAKKAPAKKKGDSDGS